MSFTRSIALTTLVLITLVSCKTLPKAESSDIQKNAYISSLDAQCETTYRTWYSFKENELLLRDPSKIGVKELSKMVKTFNVFNSDYKRLAALKRPYQDRDLLNSFWGEELLGLKLLAKSMDLLDQVIEIESQRPVNASTEYLKKLLKDSQDRRVDLVEHLETMRVRLQVAERLGKSYGFKYCGQMLPFRNLRL